MEIKDYKIILNQVFDYFQQITQWVVIDIDNAAGYNNKIISLIDAIEDDLFSIRRTRFKKGYIQKYKTSGSKLYDRFYFIVKELELEKSIDKRCYFGIEEMHTYYVKLSQLRETFNK